ncbi:CopG family transcriptional regulator [Paramesorhizobium deserti]|uniref:CopG family transcriptional regulator n=1 Tax=Paramesorhizobium deserti TaxID=1494590 RepID=A0A135I1V6_9HYPH|nr:CopG family transcriptional regulator [Paramesorhizobium deserti]KXF79422.1 CopG family transcriptional regulator [Paramesorhizobium deserti]
MKQQLSVYLEPDQLRALIAYADRHKVSKSVVAEAAIASFLSPDTAERQEAAITRRLDRLTRQLQRCERDIGISVETIALFVRFWLISTPALPESSHAAVRAKGLERYESFVEALGRRLAKGPRLQQELPDDEE